MTATLGEKVTVGIFVISVILMAFGMYKEPAKKFFSKMWNQKMGYDSDPFVEKSDP